MTIPPQLANIHKKSCFKLAQNFVCKQYRNIYENKQTNDQTHTDIFETERFAWDCIVNVFISIIVESFLICFWLYTLMFTVLARVEGSVSVSLFWLASPTHQK